jgi:hypothetical protein
MKTTSLKWRVFDKQIAQKRNLWFSPPVMIIFVIIHFPKKCQLPTRIAIHTWTKIEKQQSVYFEKVWRDCI